MQFYERLTTATDDDRQALFAIPLVQRALLGDVSKSDYLAFLGQAYHHVRHTVPLLMGCGYRLPNRLDWLRAAIADYIQEEHGHEHWILDDIRTAGGDVEAARAAPPLPATELMVAYAYDVIERRNPLGFFGMVLVLESTSVQLACKAAAAIQHGLDLPERAFRYLNSHGELDQNHIQHLTAIVNRIDHPADQADLIHCARMFYQLYGAIFRNLSH